MCMQNCTDTGGLLQEIVTEEMWTPWNAAADYFDYSPWLFSLLGSTMVGLTGIVPLLVIPIEEGADLKTGASAGTLKILLSFAVGGLLGDVFLHLLPEAWHNENWKTVGSGHPSMACGLWVLSGFLVFVIVEKIFAVESDPEEPTDAKEPETGENLNHQAEKEMENNNCITLVGGNAKNGLPKRYAQTEFSKAIAELQPFLERTTGKNGYTQLPNGYNKDTLKNGFAKPAVLQCKDLTKTNGFTAELSTNGYIASQNSILATDTEKTVATTVKEKPKMITGYLNLMANIIDNFTHGLAVGGSFLVSFRLGALTTFAILIHEIPHEVGDFAILLRSGFSRWDAARAQLVTASGGIFGAMFAVFFSGGVVGAKTSWILPFTAGGFLHIGMVNILPELLKESNPKDSLKQLFSLLLGIIVMAVLTILCD